MPWWDRGHHEVAEDLRHHVWLLDDGGDLHPSAATDRTDWGPFQTVVVDGDRAGETGKLTRRSRRCAEIGGWVGRSLAATLRQLWRDLGYAVGALLAGVVADAFGLTAAIWVIAALTLTSGIVAAVRMRETLRR